MTAVIPLISLFALPLLFQQFDRYREISEARGGLMMNRCMTKTNTYATKVAMELTKNWDGRTESRAQEIMNLLDAIKNIESPIKESLLVQGILDLTRFRPERDCLLRAA